MADPPTAPVACPPAGLEDIFTDDRTNESSNGVGKRCFRSRLRMPKLLRTRRSALLGLGSEPEGETPSVPTSVRAQLAPQGCAEALARDVT